MRMYIICTSMRNFSWNFLTFFQKLPSAYIFVNRTNSWKFVIIVFNTYLNFIKLSNTSTIIWKVSIEFEQVFCKIYTNFIHNLPNFLKNFLHDFQNFNKFFQNIPLIFFSKFLQLLLKSNTFLKFSFFFWTVSQSFVDILSIFLQIPQIFFHRFTQSLNKITSEICPHFYSVLLKNFLTSFRSGFKFFLILKLFFLQNVLSVISCLNFFILCFVRLLFIYKNSGLFNIRSKILQIVFKILSSLK